MSGYEDYSTDKFDAIIKATALDLDFSERNVQGVIRSVRRRRLASNIVTLVAGASMIGLYMSGVIDSMAAEAFGRPSGPDSISILKDVAVQHGFSPQQAELADNNATLLFNQQLGHCAIHVQQRAAPAIQPAHTTPPVSYVINSDGSNFLNVTVPNYEALKHTDMYTGCVLID